MSTLAKTNEITPEWVGIVVKQIESLRYGVVQITVHESRVVQIEKTEKLRVGLYLNNVLDETYFRGNFPSLYGNSNVLPGLPFNWSLEATYKF